MSKFYEVSKVLDKRTDLGCVGFRGAEHEETANNQHRETCVRYHADGYRDL